MQPENSIRCPDCRQCIQEFQFRSHIRNCSRFTGVVYKNINRLPKNLTALELKFIISQLDICRENLEQKLLETQPFGQVSTSTHQIPTSTHQIPTSTHQASSSVQQANRKSKIEQQSPAIDVSAYSQDIVTCKKCTKRFYASFDASSLFYVEECWHLFCLACIKKYIDDEFVNSGGSLACMANGCKKCINEDQIRQLVGDKKFDEMQNKAIRKMMNIIECAKCHTEYQFTAGNSRDAPAKDNNGKALTEVDKQHFAQNRFACPKPDCKAQQCKECKAVPYHVGMNCKDFQSRATMMKCRYCDEPLTAKNQSNSSVAALVDICNKKDCQVLAGQACTKMLACGHPCGGVKCEENCLPCLREPCCKDNPELNGQSGDDYCNVCFIEALTAAPCVRSHCGHIYHEKCLKKRYDIRWLTPRIFFNFCLCPLCKKWITLPQEARLYPWIKANTDLFNKIQTMSLQRLKFEGCEKDQKLKDPKSPYYQKQNEYAMAIYAYFECFKCKNPYFGGRKNCAEAMNQPQNAGSFKPEQLICPNCCEIPIENCPKHGNDFIEFKCKFCCSTAQWFCWGNTHFCEPCHKKQCNGDYVSKYSKDKLPVCPGPGKCPVGGNHNGNGEEKSLGCSICRNYKDNKKNF